MFTVTSRKRLASLGLAAAMVASLISASANQNTQIYINDELAIDGAEYDSAAVVTVKGDDVNSVTVNGAKVELGEDNSFELIPVEELTPAETKDEPAVPVTPEETKDEPAAPVTPEETKDEPAAPVTPEETKDEPATADNSTSKTPAESGAKADGTEVLYGDVMIAVYNSANELTSSVSVKFVEQKTEPTPETTPDVPVNPVTTPDVPVNPVTTPDVPVDPETTPDVPVDPETTPDVPPVVDPETTPDAPIATPDAPIATPDTPVATPDTPVATPDTPVATPDTPIATPDDPTPGPAPVVYKTGDLDNDGVITANDALMVLRASVKLKTLNDVETAAGDVDNDGYITSSDALKVLRVSIKLDSFEA